MIKLVCGILFLMITNIHASEYLEDIDLKKTQKVLFAARASRASGTIYDKIYAEARTFKVLKGTDAESLFLNLYFSACFLEHKMNLELNPEKLSDNLYRHMLDPLERNLNGMFLTALDLTGILSRVNGMFKTEPREITIDPQKLCDTAFSRLITGRGRFQLKEVNEEKRRQLIFDIYRHYNLNDPMFGMASKRYGAAPNVDLLWSEIVGGSLEPAKRVLDPATNSIQEHALNCFIVAYFASHSPEYRLSDYETSRASLFSYLIGKLGNGLRGNESMWDNHFRYFYDIVSSQITSGDIRQEALSAFYDANVQQDAQRNGRLNQQFDILRQFDISNPDDSNDGISSLKTYLAERHFDYPNSTIYLAHSLGVLSFQTKLTSYSEWQEMMSLLKSNVNMPERIKFELWEKLNETLSKNPLRKSLSSFFADKIAEDKVRSHQKKDPRYQKEKTLKQIQKEWDEKEQREKKARQEQAKRDAEAERIAAERRFSSSGLLGFPSEPKLMTSADVTQLTNVWNSFRRLSGVIHGLEPNTSLLRYDLISFEDVLPNFYTNFSSVGLIDIVSRNTSKVIFKINFSKFKKAYLQLSYTLHPDRATDKYQAEFQYLSKVYETINTNFIKNKSYEYLTTSPLWDEVAKNRELKQITDQEVRDGAANAWRGSSYGYAW